MMQRRSRSPPGGGGGGGGGGRSGGGGGFGGQRHHHHNNNNNTIRRLDSSMLNNNDNSNNMNKQQWNNNNNSNNNGSGGGSTGDDSRRNDRDHDNNNDNMRRNRPFSNNNNQRNDWQSRPQSSSNNTNNNNYPQQQQQQQQQHNNNNNNNNNRRRSHDRAFGKDSGPSQQPLPPPQEQRQQSYSNNQHQHNHNYHNHHHHNNTNNNNHNRSFFNNNNNNNNIHRNEMEDTVQTKLVSARDQGFDYVVDILSHDPPLHTYNTCNISTALHALGSTRRKLRPVKSNAPLPPVSETVCTIVKSLFELASQQNEFRTISLNSAITGVFSGNLHELAPESWQEFAKKCVEFAKKNIQHFKLWEALNVIEQLRTLNASNVEELLDALLDHLSSTQSGPISTIDSKRPETDLTKLVSFYISKPTNPKIHQLFIKIADGLYGMPNNSPRQGVEIICALAKSGISGSNNVDIHRVVNQWAPRFQINSNSNSNNTLSESDCSRLIWACGTMQIPSTSLFTQISNMLLSSSNTDAISKLESAMLSNILWGYATMEHSSPELFRAIAKNLLTRDLDTFSGNSLANVAWSLASLPTTDSTLTMDVFRKIATSISTRPSLDDWSGQSLTNTAWAFSVIGMGGDSNVVIACERIFKELEEKKLNTLSYPELVFIALAAANLSVKRDLFFISVVKAMNEIENGTTTSSSSNSTVVPRYTGLDLQDAAWAFACANILHHPEIQEFFTRSRPTHSLDLASTMTNLDGYSRWQAIITAWNVATTTTTTSNNSLSLPSELLNQVISIFSNSNDGKFIDNLSLKSSSVIVTEILTLLLYRNKQFANLKPTLVDPSKDGLVDIMLTHQDNNSNSTGMTKNVGLIVLNKTPFLSDGQTYRAEAEFLRRIILARDEKKNENEGKIKQVEFIGVDEWNNNNNTSKENRESLIRARIG
jgi:hypothetical protein